MSAETGLLLFRDERQHPKKGRLTPVVCAVSHACAMSCTDDVITISCRIKSLVKDKWIAQVLLSLFSKSLHCIPIWKSLWWFVWDSYCVSSGPSGHIHCLLQILGNKKGSQAGKSSRIDPGRDTVLFATQFSHFLINFSSNT